MPLAIKRRLQRPELVTPGMQPRDGYQYVLDERDSLNKDIVFWFPLNELKAAGSGGASAGPSELKNLVDPENPLLLYQDALMTGPDLSGQSLKGNCLRGDGSVDYACTKSNVVTGIGTGPFTISWRGVTRKASNTGAFTMANGTYAPGFYHRLGASPFNAGVYWAGTFQSGRLLTQSEWYHIVMQRDAANYVRYWINGVETSSSGTQTTTSFWVNNQFYLLRTASSFFDN